MQRLLVTIIDTRLTKRFRDKSGFEFGRHALRVRVQGGAIEALSVPDRVVGREASLVRDFLLPWAPKKGDPLVLDPTETARILAPRSRSRSWDHLFAERESVTFEDVDRDGFAEDVIAGRFAAAAVQSHRGARLSSLVDPSGHDRLGHPLDYLSEGKYVLLGGTEALVEESGSPGEFWNASLSQVGPRAVPGALELGYRHGFKNPEGLALSKFVEVESDLPIVSERYILSYAGKRTPETETGPDGRPEAGRASPSGGREALDETPATFAVRIWPAVLGEVPSMNVLDVPGRGALRTVRFHPPQFSRRWRWRDWRDEHFGGGPGFALWRHERMGRPTAVLFNPRLVSYVSLRSDFEGPVINVRYATKHIPKGGRAEYGLGYLVGDAFAASGSSLLLISKGRKRGRAVPMAVTLRTSKHVRSARVVIATASGTRSCTLTPREIPGAGRVHVKVLEFPAGSFPLAWSLKLPGETLRCEVKE
jgi:hypothetical protein